MYVVQIYLFFFVLSINFVALFHVPQTEVGGIALPPCCQSPILLLAPFTVRSVMNKAGHKGLPPPQQVGHFGWREFFSAPAGNAGLLTTKHLHSAAEFLCPRIQKLIDYLIAPEKRHRIARSQIENGTA